MSNRNIKKQIIKIDDLNILEQNMYNQIQRYEKAMNLHRQAQQQKIKRNQQRNKNICINTAKQLVKKQPIKSSQQVMNLIEQMLEFQNVQTQVKKNQQKRINQKNQNQNMNNFNEQPKQKVKMKQKLDWKLSRKLREFEVKQNKARIQRMRQYQINKCISTHKQSFI